MYKNWHRPFLILIITIHMFPNISKTINLHCQKPKVFHGFLSLLHTEERDCDLFWLLRVNVNNLEFYVGCDTWSIKTCHAWIPNGLCPWCLLKGESAQNKLLHIMCKGRWKNPSPVAVYTLPFNWNSGKGKHLCSYKSWHLHPLLNSALRVCHISVTSVT